jgi:cell division protein FtsB
MYRRLTIGLFALVLAGLQYRLWSSDGGIIDTRRLRTQVADEHAANLQLKSRNAAMDAEVADLKAGGPAIEAHARQLLGMVKPGETFYLVVDRND